MGDDNNLPGYELTPVNTQYLEQIIELYKIETGRTLSSEKIEALIKIYPGVLLLFDSRVVGFAFTERLAPDILELSNIYISKKYQNKSFGNALLENIEQEAKKEYAAIVAINSLLYTNEDKRLADNFYLKNDYELVFNTGSTKVFAKTIANTQDNPDLQ